MVRKHTRFSALPRSISVRAALIAGGLGSLFLAAPNARAQNVSGDFSVQRFDPAPGPRNYFTTRGVRTDGAMVWSAGLMANYGFKPFVVRSCQSLTDCSAPNARATETKVIENMLTGDAMVSLTPVPRVQLGLRVPVTWVKGQGVDQNGRASAAGIDAVGVGDAELEAKFRLHGEVKDPFVVGLGLFATGPLGHLSAKGKYIGDTLPSAGIRAIFDGEKGPYSVGGNLTGVFRDSATVGSTHIGSEFRFNVAGGFRLSPVVRIVVDGFGTTRFSARRGEDTLEADGGLQVQPLASPLVFSLGGGTGVIEGVGVPSVRAFVGLLYISEKKDRDDDGIDDSIDQCPTDPEDKDGYEDSDGCPDPDNDLDTIPDKVDKCPNQPEDQDGFQDTDGCPDPDNDGDGIPDVSDQCPNEPETKNGFKDEDGCPDEADRDNDGVPDSRDKCPDAPEDTDGFQDTDGCPDVDNDNDGVPDTEDECIDEPGPGTKNGCPKKK